MRRAIWATPMLIVGAAVAQEPAPVPVTTVPPRVVVPVRRPPLDILYPPPVPLVVVPEIGPAQQIAQMEVGRILSPADPRVVQAALFLERMTALYVEDAPRIAELTMRVCDAIRRANRPASPFAMLDGALRVPRPTSLPPGVPRSFEDYAALYGLARLDAALDHAGAIARIQAAVRPPRTP